MNKNTITYNDAAIKYYICHLNLFIFAMIVWKQVTQPVVFKSKLLCVNGTDQIGVGMLHH